MTGNLRRFRRRALTSDQGKALASRALETPIAERAARASELHLGDPEVLLALFGMLRDRWQTEPADVLAEAEFAYHYLRTLEPDDPHGPMVGDEREYFLGEAARIAGTTGRLLSRRDEARRWFDLSEGWFFQTANAVGNLAQLSYQKLALRTEERQFAEVLELLPQLVRTFESLEMFEDALKCRFLEGQALRETDRLPEAVTLFQEIARRAKELGKGNLLGMAYGDLMQIHASLGEAEKAFDLACEATPLLLRLGNRIALAKLQWGLAILLRSQSKLAEAVDAFRVAQREFAEIKMRADVAAIQLAVADLLFELGQDAQARWEIQVALPVIDEFKLVPEGVAALSLLRKSLAGHRINREALRDLHGYFRNDE